MAQCCGIAAYAHRRRRAGLVADDYGVSCEKSTVFFPNSAKAFCRRDATDRGSSMSTLAGCTPAVYDESGNDDDARDAAKSVMR